MFQEEPLLNVKGGGTAKLGISVIRNSEAWDISQDPDDHIPVLVFPTHSQASYLMATSYGTVSQAGLNMPLGACTSSCSSLMIT